MDSETEAHARSRQRFRRSLMLLTTQRFFVAALGDLHAKHTTVHSLQVLLRLKQFCHDRAREIRVRDGTEGRHGRALVQKAINALHLRHMDVDGDGVIDEGEVSMALSQLRAEHPTTRADNALVDGDAAMHAATHLIRRYRNRKHPDVLRQLCTWWEELTRHSGSGTSDQKPPQAIDKRMYSVLHAGMRHVLKADGQIEGGEHASDTSMEADWETDSGGTGVIDRAHFYDAIFQLADAWTVSTEPAEYVAFLERIGQKVFARLRRHWEGAAELPPLPVAPVAPVVPAAPVVAAALAAVTDSRRLPIHCAAQLCKPKAALQEDPHVPERLYSDVVLKPDEVVHIDQAQRRPWGNDDRSGDRAFLGSETSASSPVCGSVLLREILERTASRTGMCDIGLRVGAGKLSPDSARSALALWERSNAPEPLLWPARRYRPAARRLELPRQQRQRTPGQVWPGGGGGDVGMRGLDVLPRFQAAAARDRREHFREARRCAPMRCYCHGLMECPS